MGCGQNKVCPLGLFELGLLTFGFLVQDLQFLLCLGFLALERFGYEE